jgi:hypothetical protein
MPITASLVLLGFVGGAMLLSWSYFRRYALHRPPVGVFNLADVGVMIGGIVLVPYLYLATPTWLVTGLLAAGALSALAVAWEPVVRKWWAIWLATLLPIGLVFLLADRRDELFYAANNLVLVGIVVGLSNLWAQSGLSARNTAILAVALTVYDLVATSMLPLMGDLFARLAGLPLAPLLAWPIEDSRWLGIGLGDTLLAAVFPLVMCKAFGRVAGWLAMGLGLVTCATLLALSLLGILHVTFPVMAVLGPLMLAQYAIWRRGRVERSTLQYRQAEPPTSCHRSRAA